MPRAGAQRAASSDAMTRAAVARRREQAHRAPVEGLPAARRARRRDRRPSRRSSSSTSPPPGSTRTRSARCAQLVRELGREHTVVLSTHILSEVEACATRVLLIHRGKIVAEGPTAQIRAMRGGHAVAFVVRGDADAGRGVARGPSMASRRWRRSRRGGTRRQPAPGDVRGSRAGRVASAAARGAAVERCVAALVGAGIGVREVRAVGRVARGGVRIAHARRARRGRSAAEVATPAREEAS